MTEEQLQRLKEIGHRRFHGNKVFGRNDVVFLLNLISEQSAQLEMWAANADEAAKRAQEREKEIALLNERLKLCSEEDGD